MNWEELLDSFVGNEIIVRYKFLISIQGTLTKSISNGAYIYGVINRRSTFDVDYASFKFSDIDDIIPSREIWLK
jgi:hypothetical protein